ncbi:MAG: methylmalonyl Co-A mutase-associated GTPase MeaB [Chloroflexi bacterium]|nr:methylmalonyl Co-A mutase-associated GTPase MeaB [Chloroflexota bacterium]
MIAIDALRAGEPRAMARAISTVERGDADTRALIGAIFRFTGNAHVIGITGSPGTGKSTLVNALAKYFRKLNSRVGILAVDPTSPFTGGALLGDRVRMQDLSGDAGVFIRSMATRGALGGLAPATFDAIQVLDAAGCEIILVETVGAGQSEVDIVKHAHTTIVVQAPGMGDDIQANKAGILEIADVIVVNKADRDEANATMAVLEMNLNLKPRTENEWRAPVLKTIAIKADGIAQVVEAVNNHRAHLLAHQQWQARARARWRAELQAVLEREFLARMYSGMQAKKFDALVEKIAARELDVYAAAEQWTENQT